MFVLRGDRGSIKMRMYANRGPGGAMSGFYPSTFSRGHFWERSNLVTKALICRISTGTAEGL